MNANNVVNDVQIHVVYDNYSYHKMCLPDWGFACVIQGLEKTILFDTGGKGDILLHNMQQLGIDPAVVNLVVLSHDHYDHTGGLSAFLEKNNKARVFLLPSFSSSCKAAIKKQGADFIMVEGPTQICKEVFLTGNIGDAIAEQAVIVKTGKGAIVITGCAHPGIISIIKNIKKEFTDTILLALGGFHLHDASKLSIEKVVQACKMLGVEYIGPCHCSGDDARKIFKKEFGLKYVEIGVGRDIALKDL